jgi:hypothetical protein
MPTEIHFQGGSLQVRESFDTVRKNFDAAAKAKIDYEKGSIDGLTRASEQLGTPDQRLVPHQRCTFHLLEGDAKVALNPEKEIALVDLAEPESE